jgi:GT2 family glycosyltransferase
MTNSIICILNVFKRPQIFQEQLNAVMNQTVPPKRIIIWNNNNKLHIPEEVERIPNIIIINTTQNLGVWARFFSLYYLLAGEYVCVFDDDTIPGNKWFENCINTIKTYNALIGTIGVYFKEGNKYDVEKRYGWDGPCNTIKIVDIVGHSWFFKKEWISTLIKELPNIDEEFLTCGEDMHLSYVLSKYLYIPTIVAPHPENNTQIWGADKQKSLIYGNIDSTFCSTGIEKFTEVLKHYINNGFETIYNKAHCIKKYNHCIDYFLNKILKKHNFTLLRYADGEYYVLENIQLTNIDNWTFKKGSILCKHLNESLSLINTNVYYGISGPSDSQETCNYYYSKIINQHNITYANVLVNQNFEKWVQFLKSYNENCVLISSSIPNNNKIGALTVIETILIDPFLVNSWDAEWQTYFTMMNLLGKKYKDTLFLISAGPLSEVFIHRLYISNPNNIYIDVGSSIDMFTKNRITREYQCNRSDAIEVKDLPVIL